MPEEDGDPEQVKTSDYRWRYLSTVLAIFIGVWFPVWVTLSSVQRLGIKLTPGGAVMSVLTIGWLTVIVYAVGTDALKAVYKVLDKSQ